MPSRKQNRGSISVQMPALATIALMFMSSWGSRPGIKDMSHLEWDHKLPGQSQSQMKELGPSSDEADVDADIRSSSRGPFELSFSCLPPFSDGRAICGGRNPQLMDEAHEKQTDGYEKRIEAFYAEGGDHGHALALATAKTNMEFMKQHNIQAYITLEPGHVAECATERAVLKDQGKVADANSPEAWRKARSCGNDAVGFQDQGNCMNLKEASSVLGSGERWALVPLPDAAAVRLPYMRLWRKYANGFFDTHCQGNSTACRIMTHCVGGNGRTGMMLMVYFLDQLYQGKVIAEVDALGSSKKNDYMDVRINSKTHVHDPLGFFAAMRKLYYLGSYAVSKEVDNTCTAHFCTAEYLQGMVAKSDLPTIDKEDIPKLQARCHDACFICQDQAMNAEYKKGNQDVYSPGSLLPGAVVEAMVVVTVLRGLKSGEFFHINPGNHPPGQCMRLVQWWHCLQDADFSIKYKLDAWPQPLLLDCKDNTPFAGNEFGVYCDISKDPRCKRGGSIGPEENPGVWQPTKYELQQEAPVVHGGAGNGACPNDPHDTLECKLSSPDKQQEQRALTQGEKGIEARNAASNEALALVQERITMPMRAHDEGLIAK